MAAPGQDSPAPVADPANGAGEQQTDPWTETLQGVDEVYRPHVEQTVNSLRETLNPRLELADRLEPLGSYADDLLALAQDADEEGNSTLQDVLGFTGLLMALGDENPDPQAVEEFSAWWEQMGEQFGLFDDDGDGDSEYDGDAGDGDPQSELTQRLDRLEQENQALRQELGTLGQNDRVAAEERRITSALEKGLTENKIEDNEENRQVILRLASTYVQEPNAIELGIADYLKLTGGAQSAMLDGEEVERVNPASASPRGGRADYSPEEIVTGNPRESRARAKAAAMSRLQSG